MDRPLLYAVAVIVGRLPADLCADRALRNAVQADGRHHGFRAGRLADRHVDAAAGAVLVVHAPRRARAAQRDLRRIRAVYIRGLDVCLARPWATTFASACCWPSLLLMPRIGAEFMPKLDEGALWVRATMPYTISFDEAAKIAPQGARDPALVPRSDDGRLGAGPARRRHRSDRLLQRRILRRPQAVLAVDAAPIAPRPG